MDKAKIIDILNEDRGYELAATMQYMGHHYTASGMDALPFIDEIKAIAIQEMKHAESLAERIAYLGGMPTKNPTEIMQGGTLDKMVHDDLASEEGAIARYKAHITVCDAEGDTTTRLMLEQILSQEEEHASTLETMLGEHGRAVRSVA